MGEVKLPMLIKKGAEANLYFVNWQGREAVIKKRLPKKYRPPQLDEQIRKYRTTHEPQLLHEAKKAKVHTPLVYLVDVKNTTIIMEFIRGKQLKQWLGEVSEAERRQLCFKVGESIGKLHQHAVVHSDLTTSNMILNSEGKIFFVDFGLGEITNELEARAVDLHLMKRALQSAHFRFAEDCFNAVMKGYCNVLGLEHTKEVFAKIGEIERRGRYVTERKE